MALFETVKDIMFAEIMETTLTEISKELLRANELKEKELALKSKELEILNSEEFKYNHIERYKCAFLDACNRLEELDRILYEMDQTVEPMSNEEYKEAILSNIQNMDKNQYDCDKTKDYEISSKEFIDYTNRLDSAKLEGKEYYKKINEKFGDSFMYYDIEERLYVCYDFLYGDVGLPNIETIKDREMAIEWLEGKIEMNEVIHNSYIR